jgi:hypothetical protein
MEFSYLILGVIVNPTRFWLPSQPHKASATVKNESKKEGAKR